MLQPGHTFEIRSIALHPHYRFWEGALSLLSSTFDIQAVPWVWARMALVKALRAAKVLMPNSSLKSSGVRANTSMPETRLARNACATSSTHVRAEGLSSCINTCRTHLATSSEFISPKVFCFSFLAGDELSLTCRPTPKSITFRLGSLLSCCVLLF